jgi:hypothetical protein
MVERPEYPLTVAPTWHPRSEAWGQRAPSRFVGAPDRPLFIGACPRSGTTLLRVMLDNHPDLAIPHETNFVRPLWWQRVRFGDLRDPGNRRRVAEWIFTEEGHRSRRLRAGRISRQDAIRRVAEAPPTVGSIAQACLQLRAEADGKPRWGDKRPSYSGFIGMLFAMFPDAQYINLVRDPRAAVASQIAMGWDASEVAVPAATARWEAAVRRTDYFARRLRPDQFLDLRYEDMVIDPHVMLERICAFAGLRADDAVETMIGERRGSFRGPHKRVAEPVTTASIERWRERLDPHQVALVERATTPVLDRFGYRIADGLGADPAPRDVRELARARRARRRNWRRSQRGELLRRAVYRRPVAAVASCRPS